MRYPSRGAPVWLYICNQARVYKCPSQIHNGFAFLCLQVDLVESLYRSTSIMGQTRHTNPWVPNHSQLTSYILSVSLTLAVMESVARASQRGS
jgi:hypothetical protein